MFVTNQIVVHAGRMAPLKLLTTEPALLPVESSRLYFQLLIPLAAAMVLPASVLVAMVAKLQLHGLGSKRLVLFQEEISEMVLNAMTTLWRNVLIT